MTDQTHRSTSPMTSPASVVVIGNFDGVHRGHAALIRAARASDPTARLVAVTFWPHPMSVIRPDQTPSLLTTLPRRIELLRPDRRRRGRSSSPFTSEVASWSPDPVRGRGAAAAAPDHGRGRRELPLRLPGRRRRRHSGRAGPRNVQVHRAATGDRRHATELVDAPSGTRWPTATSGGSRELCDHPFRFTGVVVRGDQRGRALGFPTANLPVGAGMAVPADGVYAGWLIRLDSPDRTALAGCDLGRHQPDLRRGRAAGRGLRARTATTWSSTGSRWPSSSTPGCAAR